MNEEYDLYRRIDWFTLRQSRFRRRELVLQIGMTVGLMVAALLGLAPSIFT